MLTTDPLTGGAAVRPGDSSPVQNHLFAHTPFAVVYDCS